MIPNEDENCKKLRDPLPKSKAVTFVSLYEAEKKEREKSAAIETDRMILQRIITAYDAGRRVDLLQLRVSLCFACYRRYQWSATIWKSIRDDRAAVSGGMEHPRVTPVPGRSTIVIAGQELVMALGRPSECNKFDDLVDRFLKAALVCGKDYDRIDVAFDGYREAIFPFHALTGCDTVSFFAKHSKKTAWKAFAHHLITKRYWKVLQMETWMTRL